VKQFTYDTFSKRFLLTNPKTTSEPSQWTSCHSPERRMRFPHSFNSKERSLMNKTIPRIPPIYSCCNLTEKKRKEEEPWRRMEGREKPSPTVHWLRSWSSSSDGSLGDVGGLDRSTCLYGQVCHKLRTPGEQNRGFLVEWGPEINSEGYFSI